MKRLRTITAGAAVLAVALSGAALADRNHGGEHGQGMGHRMAMQHGGHGGHGGGMRHGQGMEQRLTTLKSELKLAAQQEAAWQTFEQTVKAQQAAHGQGHVAMHQGADPMQSRIAHMEQRLAGMKAVAKARDDLYQVLTPEQKTVADRFFGGRHG